MPVGSINIGKRGSTCLFVTEEIHITVSWRLQTRKLCHATITTVLNFGLPILNWKPTLCSLTIKSKCCLTGVLWAAGCIQQLKLLFLQQPSHPRVSQGWPYCQQTQWGHWFIVKHSKPGLKTSSHHHNSTFHLLRLQSLQKTQCDLCIMTLLALNKTLVNVFKKLGWFMGAYKCARKMNLFYYRGCVNHNFKVPQM